MHNKLNLSERVIQVLAVETESVGLLGNTIKEGSAFSNDGQLFDTNLYKTHLVTLFQMIETNLKDENNIREFKHLIDKQLPYSDAQDLVAWGILLPWFRSQVDNKTEKRKINGIVSNLGIDILRHLASQCSSDSLKKIIGGNNKHSPIMELFGYFSIHLYYQLSQESKGTDSPSQNNSTSDSLHYQYCYWISGTGPSKLPRSRLEDVKNHQTRSSNNYAMLERDAEFISKLANEDNISFYPLATNMADTPPGDVGLENLENPEEGLLSQLRLLLESIHKSESGDIAIWTRLAIMNKMYYCILQEEAEPNPSKKEKRKEMIEQLQVKDNPFFASASDLIESFVIGNDKPCATKTYWGHSFTRELNAFSKENLCSNNLNDAISFMTQQAVANPSPKRKAGKKVPKPSIKEVADTLGALFTEDNPWIDNMKKCLPECLIKLDNSKLSPSLSSLCQVLTQVGEINGLH